MVKKSKDEVLKKDEKECKDFIKMAFEQHTEAWKSTADRLLDAYKGRYYKDSANKQRFTHNSIFGLVNVMLPNFMFHDPYIKVRAGAPSTFIETKDGGVISLNSAEQAEVMEAVINHELNEIDAFDEAKKALQDVFFYGFGVVKVGYSFETASSNDEDVVTKDNCFVKRINPRDFGWHALATSTDDSTKLVQRLYFQKEDLENMEFLDQKAVKSLEYSLPDHMKKKLNCSNGHGQTVDKVITVYEVHDQRRNMYYYYGGEGYTYLGKKKREYLFKGSDFVILSLAKDIDEFKGIPLLEMVEDEAIALNDIMTLTVEHIKKFPGQVYVQEGSADEDQVERLRQSEQGSIHAVRDLSGIKLTGPLSMGQDYFQTINMLIRLTDRTLGIPDFQRLTSTTRKSATESNFIQGDATVRRNYYLQLIKEFYISIIQRVASLKMQFTDEKETILATGDLNARFVEYSKEDIAGKWVFDYDVDNMAAINQGDVNNMINMLNTVAQNEALKPILSLLAPLKLGKALFNKVNLNLSSYLTSHPENQIHVSPTRENELARSGTPMPQPKKGENYSEHLTAHLRDIQTQGPDEQILQHFIDTLILAHTEGKLPEEFVEIATNLGLTLQQPVPPNTPTNTQTPTSPGMAGPEAETPRQLAPNQQPPESI